MFRPVKTKDLFQYIPSIETPTLAYRSARTGLAIVTGNSCVFQKVEEHAGLGSETNYVGSATLFQKKNAPWRWSNCVIVYRACSLKKGVHVQDEDLGADPVLALGFKLRKCSTVLDCLLF
jgi:hypothetical protein